jgi:hypothetical protein
VLFESWLSAGGDWKKSKLFLQAKTSKSQRKNSIRRWFTLHQLQVKHGEEVAEAMVQRKLQNESLKREEVRAHPDLPELQQFLVLDEEAQEDSEEEVFTHLFEAVEASSSSSSESSSASAKKAKKKG